MAKFKVVVREIITYTVTVSAPGKIAAAEAGIEKIVQAADRDKYFTACQERDVLSVKPVLAKR